MPNAAMSPQSIARRLLNATRSPQLMTRRFLECLFCLGTDEGDLWKGRYLIIGEDRDGFQAMLQHLLPFAYVATARLTEHNPSHLFLHGPHSQQGFDRVVCLGPSQILVTDQLFSLLGRWATYLRMNGCILLQVPTEDDLPRVSTAAKYSGLNWTHANGILIKEPVLEQDRNQLIMATNRTRDGIRQEFGELWAQHLARISPPPRRTTVHSQTPVSDDDLGMMVRGNDQRLYNCYTLRETLVEPSFSPRE
ncbi:MAG: hypothetical protein LQ346_007764 [Caloplaca aetnensis]|nr:MAG: hypothetical protein LQ346_007764 [Caloplaca aetnensis]